MDKYAIDINGVVIADIDHNQFLDEFIDWLESKGWAFGGAVGKCIDEEQP